MAAARPQGTASAHWSLFAGGGRSCTASTGYMSCNLPGVLVRPGPMERFDQGYKTKNEFRGEELKGESNANVADGDIGTQNFAGAGAENILQGDRDNLRRRRPQGRLRGAEGGFSLAVSPFA